MEWYQILSILGVPSICATIVIGIIAHVREKISKNKAVEAAKLAEIQNREIEKEKEYRKSMEMITHRFESLEAAMQSMLRRKLRELYLSCTKAKYASLEDRDDFENMYQRYHMLGSNGVMDNVREQFLELPVDKPERNATRK